MPRDIEIVCEEARINPHERPGMIAVTLIEANPAEILDSIGREEAMLHFDLVEKQGA